MSTATPARREGFSLIEVIVALVILTFGVLAMGAAMGYVVTSVQISNLRTQRSMAVQQGAERLYSTSFDDLEDKAEGDADEVGDFRVWWDVTNQSSNLVEIDIITDGPGYKSGTGWLESAVDTFTLSLARDQGRS